MDKTQQGHIKSSVDHGVATVEFYHPSHNSLPSKLLKELTEKILECGNDPEVLFILLKSAGDRTFCAGASFDELASISNEEEGSSFFSGFANVINAIRTCGKLVIGRVHGKAVGGGVGLAAATDYCMATKYASVKLSELAVGIGPFVIGPAVQRKIGLANFSHLAINAKEWQTAKWAKSKGLFQEVFDTTEQLDAYLESFISTLKEMNPVALEQLKSIFWEGTDNWDSLLQARADISGKLVLSKFAKETIRSFLKA